MCEDRSQENLRDKKEWLLSEGKRMYLVPWPEH